MVDFDRVEEIEEIPAADTAAAGDASSGKRVYSAGRSPQRVHPSDLFEDVTSSTPEQAEAVAAATAADGRTVLAHRCCNAATMNGGAHTRTRLRRADGAEASFMRRKSTGFLRSPTSARLVDKRQESFVGKHGIVTALRIQQEAEKVKEHLARTGQLGQTLVLNPEKNRSLGRWDVLQTLALIYTATLTPFETCFVPPAVGSASWRDPWFVMK